MDLLGHSSRAGATLGPVPKEGPEGREPRPFAGLQLSLGLSLGQSGHCVAGTKERAMASSEAVSSAHGAGSSFSLGPCGSPAPPKDVSRAGQAAPGQVAARPDAAPAASSRAHEPSAANQPQDSSKPRPSTRGGAASLDAYASDPGAKHEPTELSTHHPAAGGGGGGGLQEPGAAADAARFASRVKEEAQDADAKAAEGGSGNPGQGLNGRKRAFAEERQGLCQGQSQGHGLGQELVLRGNSDAGNSSLGEEDPAIWRLVEMEKERQLTSIELIASENFVSQAVMEALGSPLCNKYSEGMPGARYYGGNQFIDAVENLCRERALKAFHLDPEEWGVNVQPYSCTSANLAVFAGLLTPPKDRIMGLDLPSGGHMSHGYYTLSGKRVAAASVFFDTLPYKVNPVTGLIDYDKMEDKAMEYRPKILICGGSSYPREWDFARCRQIADRCGAVLMCDMAHISGLVAAKEHSSPFDYADVVTSTTHKTMRGPRGGIIFYRKGPVVHHGPARRALVANGIEKGAPPPCHAAPQPTVYDYEERINFAVFPMMQGGPHDNHTAALAVALKQVGSPEYAAYMRQVKRNAVALAAALVKRGCRLVTAGTENHLLLWDLRPLGLTGQRFEKVCELCGISLNKCPLYGDSTSPPAGVRIGTPALTTRGCKEEHMEVVAELLVRVAHTTQKALLEQAKAASQPHPQPHPHPHPQSQPQSQPSPQSQSQSQSQTQSQSQGGADHPVLKQEPQGVPVLGTSDGSPPGPAGGGGGAGAGAGNTAGGAAGAAAGAGSGSGAGSGAVVPRPKRARLSDWMDQLGRSEEVRELQAAVRAFASALPMPGFGHFKVK